MFWFFNIHFSLSLVALFWEVHEQYALPNIVWENYYYIQHFVPIYIIDDFLVHMYCGKTLISLPLSCHAGN